MPYFDHQFHIALCKSRGFICWDVAGTVKKELCHWRAEEKQTTHHMISSYSHNSTATAANGSFHLQSYPSVDESFSAHIYRATLHLRFLQCALGVKLKPEIVISRSELCDRDWPTNVT